MSDERLKDVRRALSSSYEYRIYGSSRNLPGNLMIWRSPMSIFTILFVVLLIAWLLGFTVFHVAGGLIHLLLIFAVISLVLHFFRGTRGVA